MAAKPVTAARINARAARDKAFLKRALAKPGLRSKLDPKYLTGAQKKTRALNVRLNAPITPGSSVTERDLAHEAKAATTVKYGPQEGELGKTLGMAQTTARDTGTFYDQYLADLRQHSQNVQSFQAGAQQALQQTAQGITGLGSQEAAQMQTQANQAAAQQGVAPAGDLSTLANQALATRQGLMGSFQAQQAQTGAAANTYASGQANVVGPGQKLAALARAQGKIRDAQKDITDLKTQEGAFNQQFRAERRADEFKNVLAEKTLGVTAAKATADIAANSPAAQTKKAERDVDIANAKKAGVPLATWQGMSPKQQTRYLRQLSAKGSDMNKRITDPSDPFFGLTPKQVRDLPQSERDRRIRHSYNLTHPDRSKSDTTTSKEAFHDKYGVDLQPTAAHNRARDSVQNTQTAFGQVGKVVKQADGKPHRVTTDDVVSHLRDKGVSNLWIRAGLEMARGGLTAGTAKRIHDAGYSVSQLGFKMRSGERGPGRPRTEHLP